VSTPQKQTFITLKIVACVFEHYFFKSHCIL